MSTVKIGILAIVVGFASIIGWALHEHVHSERWAVKTLSDSLQVPGVAIPTTIGEQSTITGPKISEATKRQPDETTLYSLRANLVEVKKEFDNDYHLVLEDPATLKRMIAEIPDTTGKAPSKYRMDFAAARRTIDRIAGKPGFFGHKLSRPIPIELTGIGFFDEAHIIPQTGMSRNNREIHPVLSIVPIS